MNQNFENNNLNNNNVIPKQEKSKSEGFKLFKELNTIGVDQEAIIKFIDIVENDTGKPYDIAEKMLSTLLIGLGEENLMDNNYTLNAVRSIVQIIGSNSFVNNDLKKSFVKLASDSYGEELEVKKETLETKIEYNLEAIKEAGFDADLFKKFIEAYGENNDETVLVEKLLDILEGYLDVDIAEMSYILFKTIGSMEIIDNETLQSLSKKVFELLDIAEKE
jgi:hypothetical protein